MRCLWMKTLNNMNVLTEHQFKNRLQECLEFAEANSFEVYYAQAVEVLEMLIDGLEVE